MARRYVVPDAFTRRVVNPVVTGVSWLGISIAGSRVLEVRGRRSGLPRRTPVNVLSVDGGRFLVAPRGETQWVRNLRAAGEGYLLLGGIRLRFAAVEVPEEEREPVLRAYLRRWTWEVGKFFGGVTADSPAGELRRIAPDHPVFRIQVPAP
ncbi:MAG TPA: nitroreductase family deazaflavin-dependent oxidoreductase [Miltoncostaeaceae bacterium]|nr:nitroreductase family deazaflavin-dependent oxidoreductase [Miltoncostaeaceae bacterium]